MKIHDIISHTNVISESEDDLFPGLDSSAFDNVQKTSNQPNAARMLERLQMYKKQYAENTANIGNFLEFLLNNDALIDVGDEDEDDTDYGFIPWLKEKFPLAHKNLFDTFIGPNSPIMDELPKYMAKYERLLARDERLTGQISITSAAFNDSMDENAGRV